MTKTTRQKKDSPAEEDPKSAHIRISDDGSEMLYSFVPASLEDLLLAEHRRKISDQNTANSRARGVLAHKGPWQTHVRAYLDSGACVNSVADLLKSLPKDSPLHDVLPATLRKWARQAVPSLKFKAGRPPLKK